MTSPFLAGFHNSEDARRWVHYVQQLSANSRSSATLPYSQDGYTSDASPFIMSRRDNGGPTRHGSHLKLERSCTGQANPDTSRPVANVSKRSSLSIRAFAAPGPDHDESQPYAHFYPAEGSCLFSKQPHRDEALRRGWSIDAQVTRTSCSPHSPHLSCFVLRFKLHSSVPADRS